MGVRVSVSERTHNTKDGWVEGKKENKTVLQTNSRTSLKCIQHKAWFSSGTLDN